MLSPPTRVFIFATVIGQEHTAVEGSLAASRCSVPVGCCLLPENAVPPAFPCPLATLVTKSLASPAVGQPLVL
jgi:hypothetical protein